MLLLLAAPSWLSPEAELVLFTLGQCRQCSLGTGSQKDIPRGYIPQRKPIALQVMFPKGNVAEDALFWGKPAEGTQVLLQPRTTGLQDELNYKLILLISTGADYEPTLHGGFFPPATLSSILEGHFCCAFLVSGCRSSPLEFPVSWELL